MLRLENLLKPDLYRKDLPTKQLQQNPHLGIKCRKLWIYSLTKLEKT